MTVIHTEIADAESFRMEAVQTNVLVLENILPSCDQKGANFISQALPLSFKVCGVEVIKNQLRFFCHQIKLKSRNNN